MNILWFESDVVFRLHQSSRLEAMGYRVMLLASLDNYLTSDAKSVPSLLVYDRSLSTKSVWPDLTVWRERSVKVLTVISHEEVLEKEHLVSLERLGGVVRRPVSSDDFLWAMRKLQGRYCGWCSLYCYQSGVLTLNEQRMEVRDLEGRVIPLTPGELRIFRLLMFFPERFFSSKELAIFSVDNDRKESCIQVHIRNIRKKIGGSYIRTRWKKGYAYCDVLSRK